MINDEVGRHVCIWVVQLQRQPQHTLPSLDPLKKKKVASKGKVTTRKKKSKCIYSFIYSLLCFFVCLAVSVVDQKKKK